MFDRNNKGTISIHEFADLFRYINQWKGTFEGIDRDRSGYIEFNELVQGTMTSRTDRPSSPFPFDSVADLYDSNSSGSIDINEFQQLFNCINQWKSVFQGYDTDKSGAVELAEMTKGNESVPRRSYYTTLSIIARIIQSYSSLSLAFA